MADLIKSPYALAEILEIALYIAKDSVSSGVEFIDKVEESCSLLATQPLLGARYRSENIAIHDVRFIPVRKYDRYLIFYRFHDGTIEILRVLHGARDLPGILS